MTEKTVEYQTEIGDNDVYVIASFEPGRPAAAPNLNFPGEPEEPATITIVRVYLRDPDEIILLEINDLYIRRADGDYLLIEDYLLEEAHIKSKEW